MSELLFILVFTSWYVLALVVSEKYGKNARISTEWLFFIAMVLSPVVGFIVAKINPSAKTG